jgi:phycoerythrocyanin alpha-cysteine-84 phycoviolobilin lyase/isomerase subunit PecE
MDTSEAILSSDAAIAALTGDDNQLRYYAAWWLGKHQIQAACPILCECLQDEKYRTAAGGYPLRRQVARALGILKNPIAVPALLEALKVTIDPQLQEAVIQALTAIGDRSCIPNLRSLLHSPTSPIYQEALIEALGHFEVDEVQGLIEPFLNDSSERVQCAAARYFYQITKQSSYLERIIRNLDHDNPYLRWAAAFDLGAIGHLEAVQAIIQAPIANSLKLLNLKRIIEALLSQILFQEMDQLLMQL